MTSGQLSPFASCTDGLGFMNCAADYRSSSSLLTPTASVCTVSSLGQSGDSAAESAGTAGRSRTKTMQTKDILKSPQPHRFHLVPSGIRRLVDQPSLGMSSKPSAQWRFKQDSPVMREGGQGDGVTEAGDVFSPSASPLMPLDNASPTQAAQCSYRGTGAEREATEDGVPLADKACSPILVEFRPASTCSAFSSQTLSASFTLVQDQASKRFSSASTTSSKDPCEKALLWAERSPALAVEDIPEVSACSEDQAYFPQKPIATSPAQMAETGATESDRHGDDNAAPSTIAQTTSSSLDSLVSKYGSSPDRPASPHEDPANVFAAILESAACSPKAHRRATDSSLHSPTKPHTSGRNRRKFALRRQAIYAEYGFQIALPSDSDSDPAVKVLRASPCPSPSKREGGQGQGRAASAYCALSSSGSVSSAELSASVSASSSAGSVETLAAAASGDGLREALFTCLGPAPLGGLANERLERLSVQDDILAATRNPLLDDEVIGLTTSTPPSKSRSAGQRLLAASSGMVGSGEAGSHLGDGLLTAAVAVPRMSSQTSWAPLHLMGRSAAQRQHLMLSVSRSEWDARLSAWEVDPGHHPIVRDLIDEVDRAIEQWKWTVQLRTYV
ncbi:hypothetical protein BD414DRAFT_537360 [Trametes punicea]|nr:hypothetical protein BD414DRAFT_537360 [Trametes punicea]